MASHRNYSIIIEFLLCEKSIWKGYNKPKLTEFKTALLKFEYDKNEPLTNKKLSECIGIKRSLVNQYLREIYDWAISESYEIPINIDHFHCRVEIFIPKDEYPNKGNINLNDECTWISMKLPFIPRIGEIIQLGFIEMNKFRRGTVFDIIHEINADTQLIRIQVHPFGNYYHKWRKLEAQSHWDYGR